MTAPLPLLFLGHDAGPTGAPRVLLTFLQWLKAQGVAFEIVLRDGGALVPEYSALAPTTVLGLTRGPSLNAEERQAVVARLRSTSYRLVYANTVEHAEVLDLLQPSCPVLVHAHELGYHIRHTTTAARFGRVRDLASGFVAVSRIAGAALEAFGVPRERITLIHEFIDCSRFAPSPPEDALRQTVNIPADAFVVGGAGTLDWRKGPDLFVQLAARVARAVTTRPVHFLWVGGPTRAGEVERLEHDIARLGLADRIHLAGQQDEMARWIGVFDAFALTSREDPFPLVALESAAARKPIVCFADAGGTPEFVEHDCGYVVPYLDVDAMARAVLDLVASRSTSANLGCRAAQKVRDRHDVGVAAPRLLALINDLVERRVRPLGPEPDLLALYHLASRSEARQASRARQLFEIVARESADAALSGKALYKLAVLAHDPAVATALCASCLEKYPDHSAARALHVALLAREAGSAPAPK